ncbi:hypothetical protein, conserved [Plasmodium gonderi]|uniref:PARP catalytic domain-containing protein n=1 Tax=Plasmodium gonderi TaxID=77519 RepID=A0A1Y1JBE3_PLAGO|nr:hypothetical protein, conserved [Plasmodium gonderi]GAW79570.1 hypothetical protein, conserved [Plasmodium gonderi]
MSTSDELSVLIQNLQKCNNTSESINFDLASTIQEFLNCLDKNVFEDLEKGINGSEKEKNKGKNKGKDKEKDNHTEKDLEMEKQNELMNSFTSAAIFVENCVKIFGLKIEHLHNLAHNTLYNIYKENKNNNSAKKHIIISDEEEYLFINEIKSLKNSQSENEQYLEDDLLIKTIPLPTFLFAENMKKEKSQVSNSNRSESNNCSSNFNGDEKNRNASSNLTSQGEDVEHTLNTKWTKLGKQVRTDSGDIESEVPEIDEEEEEIIDHNSIKSLNFDKIFLENDGILLLDINDYNIFINDQNDFSIQNQMSSALFEKYDFYTSNNSTYLPCANLSKYIEKEKTVDAIYKINSLNDILTNDLCQDIFLFKQDFYDYDFSLGITKNKNSMLNKFKENQKYLHLLDENSHMGENKFITTHEKSQGKKKLPHYYMLNCQNITRSQDFFRYMQPSQIIDIIERNTHRHYFSYATNQNDIKDSNDLVGQDRKQDDMSSEILENKLTSSHMRKHNLDLLHSNDEKLFDQIKIPDMYIQKLGLNFSYYHLEPLIYDLIKDLKKKKNVEKFFSINLYDEKQNYEFDILQDEEYADDKIEDNPNAPEKYTTDNFLDVRSLNDDMNDIPLEVFEKKDSSDIFFASFDEDIHDRVNKWNIFLEEKLQMMRKRPKYDVDVYKKHIINYTVNNGEKTSLSNLIKDKEPYEICRNFLTTLMLINTNMLNIREINPTSKSNDVSNYEINVIKENSQEYLTMSKRFKNTSFIIKDKKRKNDTLGKAKNIQASKRKKHKD